jgi:hypothetical protein
MHAVHNAEPARNDADACTSPPHCCICCTTALLHLLRHLRRTARA